MTGLICSSVDVLLPGRSKCTDLKCEWSMFDDHTLFSILRGHTNDVVTTTRS